MALKPFLAGAKPHGRIIELTSQTLEIDGHDGFLVLKKNYDGDGDYIFYPEIKLPNHHYP